MHQNSWFRVRFDGDESRILLNIELVEHIILPEFGELTVTPKPEFGEPSTWNNLHAFKAAVADGTLHPFDAKMGVANGLARGLANIADYFEKNPETLNHVNELTK